MPKPVQVRLACRVLLAGLLLVAPAQTCYSATEPPPVSTAVSPTPGARGRGNLFSAISLSDSNLARFWKTVLPEVRTRYSHLVFTSPEDLHITVVYIGPGWSPEALDRIRRHALVSPEQKVSPVPAVARLGSASQVVAVELQETGKAWGEAVVAAKAEMNRLGLKKPDTYDPSFRPHVTLGRASGSRPSEVESRELSAFESWLKECVARDPAPFSLSLGPSSTVRLFLAGLSGSESKREYIPVEELLSGIDSSGP